MAASEIKKQLAVKDRLVEESKQRILSLQQELRSAMEEIESLTAATAQETAEKEEAFNKERQVLPSHPLCHPSLIFSVVAPREM